MTRIGKLKLILVMTTILALVISGIALADQVVNTIDTTVDSELELREITAGGSTVVGFYIKTENDIPSGDINGCNATGALPATVTLNVPAGVTASVSSLTFTSCGTDQNVTFSSNTVGEYTISVAKVEGGKSGSKWETGPASFTLKVNPPSDTTPPVITYVLNPAYPDGANGWYISDVSVAWTVTDLESAVTIDEGCMDTTIDYDTTGVTLTCTATSAGGTASESVTIKRDATAPGVTITPDRPADYNGWYNNAINFTVAGTDAASGVASCDADFAYSDPDSASAAVTASCTDNAGNVGSASFEFQYDGTLPTISYSIAPAPAASGWYNLDTGAPTVTFICSDATAGIESCTAPYTFGEGADQSYSGTAKDNAGNTASATVSGINVDLTAPSITWLGGPQDGGVYYFGFVPEAPTCTAADELSGPNGCTVTGYSAVIGTHTLTATAYDVAGNKTVETRTYEVKAWTLFGFFQPVDMNGVFNVVKSGSTVPLKFRVFAGLTELTSTSVVKSFVQTRIACDSSAPTDEIEVTTTGGTSLRYDPVAGQFIQNWQTPKTPGVCYRVTLTTQDGSTLIAFFRLK